MGWLIALAVVTALALIPVGVSLRYGDTGFSLKLRLLFFSLKLPGGKKKKKEKEKKPEQKKPEPVDGPGEPPGKQKKPRRSMKDFLPWIRLGLDFLGSLRRKLRIEKLYAHVILAGGDPCDLAINYGRTWAGASTLMAQLNRIFVIRDQDVDISCDFTAEKTAVTARLDLTITVGRIISLLVLYGIRALRQYLIFRKGGASL